MRGLLVACFAVMVCDAAADGQITGFPQRPDMHRDRTMHTVTFAVRAYRPLLQIINAVSDEYGWSVNFEEPPFQSSFDLVDHTPESWRAAHPDKRGFLLIRGGMFRTTYTESPVVGLSPDERLTVLDHIVSDYNASGNAGKFTVRTESDGQYSVVGTALQDRGGQNQNVASVLDSPISMPATKVDAWTAIGMILDAVNDGAGAKVTSGSMPISFLQDQPVEVRGGTMAARDALRRVIAATGQKLFWRLLYDPHSGQFSFSLSAPRRRGGAG